MNSAKEEKPPAHNFGVNMAIVGGTIIGIIVIFLCCTCVGGWRFRSPEEVEDTMNWPRDHRIIEPYCSMRTPELEKIAGEAEEGEGEEDGGGKEDS